jgi:lipopolysaccharide biosynthesis glycosyltransferase
MRILLTFDTSYAPHAAATMESIIQHCPEKLDFAVIYYNLNDETQSILSKHFENKVASLEFYKVDEMILRDTIKGVKTTDKHLKGFSTYLRLFAPQLLPNDEHVIYLDVDIIVLDNILSILNDADLTKPVCAVTEYDPAYKYKPFDTLNKIDSITRNTWIGEAYWYRTFVALEMSQTAKYFNGGVCIINLGYWRQHKVAEKAIAFLMEHPEKALAADQDATNHAINGNYCTLPLRWNFPGGVSFPLYSNYSLEAVKRAVENPAIIHITGAGKPWKYMCNAKIQKKYWKYRSFTPWPEKAYEDKTWKKIIKKQVVFGLKRAIIATLGYRNAHVLTALFIKPSFLRKLRINTKIKP